MFSEYASRFLAQSQSRISFRQPEEPTRNPLERPARQDRGTARFPPSSRSYLQRPTISNPYQGAASNSPQFPFASRSNAAPAPLFYSATDEFREEDDEEEHEREVADFYALQRSRRQFVETRPEELSEGDEDGSRETGLGDTGDGRDEDERGHRRGGGIRSSWRGGRASVRGRAKTATAVEEADEDILERITSEGSSKSKDKMADVGLDSTLRSGLMNQDEPPEDLAIEMPFDDLPPSIQQLKRQSVPQNQYPQFMRQETSSLNEMPPQPDSDSESIPPTVSHPSAEPPRHDAFWGNLYFISLASLFASFLLVYLHTSEPTKPLGDTVYTTLHASFYLLAVDTVVAVIVSLLWLGLLRSYVRPLVCAILVAVPIILFAFSLYPFISSFQAEKATLQDRVMRWLATVPGFMAVFWVYAVYKGRHAFSKAVGILEFACRILAANPALLVLGFGTLAGVVVWTWVWMGMFTRVFLGGHMVSTTVRSFFLIDVGTWWLGAFFILVYLWTLGVGAGIQRATTAATVSQWYFHRLQIPAPTSEEVVRAAFNHATTTLFGTICLSTFLTLAIRLPLLVLPRRFIAFIGLCTYTVLPNSIAVLTHPLTPTYAAIHSQPLYISSRAVSQLTFMSPSGPPNAPTFRRNPPITKTSSIPPYNIALLLLHSTRLMTSLAFGFGAWVNTARSLELSSSTSASTIRGSLYAYVVGLVAGAIGWGILGAMEGVLAGVVDAVVVCWASEVRNGEVRYCREAGWLLGDDTAREGEREGLMRI
ncbi:MAG: hypothetical protein MMC33_008593 [Icmadophila ericetorum]|nr:hypothetical protein [Icmadophila ericetorum]